MPADHASHSAESQNWSCHFAANSATPDHLPWDHPSPLSEEERLCIQSSIQQFQLGEGSSGSRLLQRGLAHARATHDPHFLPALRLFVQEEQRHSSYLLRFMQREGISATSSHWIDTVFRRLRVLAGLELSLRVLVSAEIIAIPYYRALRAATKSPLLQSICARILQDEIIHLRFQSSMLARIAPGRSHLSNRVVSGLHRLFLLVTCYVVWLGHGQVFYSAGYSRQGFLTEAFREFSALDRTISRRMARTSIPELQEESRPSLTHASRAPRRLPH